MLAYIMLPVPESNRYYFHPTYLAEGKRHLDIVEVADVWFTFVLWRRRMEKFIGILLIYNSTPNFDDIKMLTILFKPFQSGKWWDLIIRA